MRRCPAFSEWVPSIHHDLRHIDNLRNNWLKCKIPRNLKLRTKKECSRFTVITASNTTCHQSDGWRNALSWERQTVTLAWVKSAVLQYTKIVWQTFQSIAVLCAAQHRHSIGVRNYTRATDNWIRKDWFQLFAVCRGCLWTAWRIFSTEFEVAHNEFGSLRVNSDGIRTQANCFALGELFFFMNFFL